MRLLAPWTDGHAAPGSARPARPSPGRETSSPCSDTIRLRYWISLVAKPRGSLRETGQRLVTMVAAPHASRRRAENPPMDKRTTTAAEAVAELRDGMTIGIGGWGSRRKPMSLVREILRSPLKDLTVVTYGGPDVGLLCAAGKVQQARLRLRVARLDPARAALPQGARRRAPSRRASSTRACSSGASTRRRSGCPFLPTRAGLGSDVLAHQPGAQDGALAVRRRRGAGRDAGARARRRASCT